VFGSFEGEAGERYPDCDGSRQGLNRPPPAAPTEIPSPSGSHVTVRSEGTSKRSVSLSVRVEPDGGAGRVGSERAPHSDY